jgi:drug/metabolite transporter (DMT)-like permease
MTRFYLIGFFVLMCFDTMAQIGFKLAAQHGLNDFPISFSPQNVGAWIWHIVGAPWIYFSVCGYLGAFITWVTLLKYAPIGPAFAASHLYIVSVMLITVAFFPLDKLGTLQVVGCLFIMGGIFVLATETGPDHRKELIEEGFDVPPDA